MAEFEVLKNVDQRTKWLISGYFREYESTFKFRRNESYYNIPELAQTITLSYFAIIEYFAQFYVPHYCILLTDDYTRIRRKADNKAYGYFNVWKNTCFGNMNINPRENSGIYQWFIKIINMKQDAMIGFGSDFFNMNANLCETVAPFYALKCSTGTLYAKYKTEKVSANLINDRYYINTNNNMNAFKNGDIICLEFKIDSNKSAENNSYIKLYVNGVDKGIAFNTNELELDSPYITYRVAVSLCQDGDSFQIIDFKHYSI